MQYADRTAESQREFRAPDPASMRRCASTGDYSYFIWPCHGGIEVDRKVLSDRHLEPAAFAAIVEQAKARCPRPPKRLIPPRINCEGGLR
jgi:ribosomal protein L20